jgi:predicted nucleotidyltransferase
MSEENQITDAELHDENVVEEAHDPKNAEVASVDSVDKAAKATTQAAAPKTKAGMINAMYGKMSKMKKADLQASYGKMMGEEVEGEEADVVAEDATAAVQFDYTTELDALVESEATLSEEFKTKTAVIFESAIKTKLAEEIDRLEETYATELAEELSTQKTELAEQVDGYLNYVVETWVEDNKVAIQSGLRTEIAEGFMEKLKDVFTESYIAVPDEKVDLVDDLSEQVKELETAINERTEEAMSLSVELDTFRREAVIAEASKGLADTQVEKLTKLVEGFEFHDAESFAEKVAIVKEANFKPEAIESTIAEETVDEASDAIAESTSDVMQTYLSAIRKSQK